MRGRTNSSKGRGRSMKRAHDRRLMGCAMIVAALAATAELPAQDTPTPGAVRQSVRQQRPEIPRTAEELPAAASTQDPLAGVPEGGPRIRIDRFDITGNKIVPTEELRALLARYEGTELTLFEIYELSDVITRYYRDRGYTVASCNVPEQRVASGVVRLEIIEGLIGEIKVEGNKRYRTSFLRNNIDRIETGKVLTEQALRAQLDPLNELPGLEAQAVIQPGTNFGESAIVFRVQEDPINGSVRVNNYGRESIGDLRVEGDLALNSIFGIGERFDVSAVQAEKDLLNYISAAYSMPIPGDLQTRAAVYYNTYDYEVSSPDLVLGLSGDGENFGVSFNHRLLWGGNTVTFGMGFDRTVTTQVMGLFGRESSDLNLLQLTGSFGHAHGNTAYTLLSGVLSTNFRGNDRAPITLRLENNAQALKARFDLGHYHKLSEFWLLLLRATVVASPDPLVDTEQFRIGGRDSIRAYASSEVGGDYGYALSAELQRSIDWLPNHPLRLSLFADVGTVFKYDAQLLNESRSDTIAGFGAGLDFQVTDNAALSLEIARRLGSHRSIDGRDAYRIWAGMNVNF